MKKERYEKEIQNKLVNKQDCRQHDVMVGMSMKECANDDNADELSLNITDAVQVTATAQKLQCYALSAVARG